MNNILFIINPIAGGGKAKSLISQIEKTMDKYNRNYDILFTKEPKEAIKIAKQNVDNYEIIVAVGGDGTINEVAKGIISVGRGILGIVPGGTGNDMAKSLGISMDPEKSLEMLNRGFKREIDIGKVNNSSFLNITSVGLDAEVIENHNKFKNRIKGVAVYILSAIYTLFNFKDKDLEIEIDGKLLKEEIMLFAVGNGKYYGGGMKIIPAAQVNDGFLHICIVSGISKLKTMILFPTIFKGNHIKYKKYVRIYKAKEIKIRAKTKISINVDGEMFPKEKDIEFKLSSQKLKVICEEK